ncbi:MAG TPA: M1 family metallopeptidase, partial [Bryobacteraceae bacterium]|nr:M1 family metallopeptidase [Bryobacteraceae bacterium]
MRFALSLLCASLVAAEAPSLRLPGDARPQNYKLDLRLDPAQDRFTGSVAIDVEVLKPVSTIWLHSAGLNISASSVDGKAVQTRQERGFLGLELQSEHQPGKARIEIRFDGALNQTDVEGLFKQVDRGDAYIFTQFEPTSARYAFPCFDEPAFKTPWEITLRVPRGMKAFANTPEASRSAQEGFDVVSFTTTKPLPTYLVAMAVGPFDVVPVGTAGRNRTPIRTIALRGRGNEAHWTNEITPKILGALEEWFGLPYPYEKLDQITIPITVGFGAMENAGLITYTQTLLLARPEDQSEAQRRSAFTVIAHELAHQWFGNMVTPAWWDDIWLNEAFASWMEDHIVARLYPEWRPEVAAAEQKARVMSSDRLISARRIRQPISNEGDIGSAFDNITYQKGSAVIAMFEQYAGKERFQQGVRNYMRKHAWGNATASDFLAAISSAAGKDLTPAFSNFLDRGGVPLVEVSVDCTAKPKIVLKQSRALPIGSKGSRDEYWSVPVCVRYEAGGKQSTECFLLSDPRDQAELRAASSCPEWLLPNDQARGYYHWLPDETLRSKLAANASKLQTSEQVDWLRNTAALSSMGRLPASNVLNLARQFADSPHREVALASLDLALSFRRMVPQESREQYESLLRSWYGARAKKLGWLPAASDSAEVRLLRRDLVPTIAQHGDDEVLAADARKLAQRWLADRSSVPAEIAGAVLKAAASSGDAAFFEKLVAAARATNNRHDRSQIVAAIGSFRHPAIARRGLGLMLTGELDIRELLPLLWASGDSVETEGVADEFVRANYDALAARLPSQLGTGAATV